MSLFFRNTIVSVAVLFFSVAVSIFWFWRGSSMLIAAMPKIIAVAAPVAGTAEGPWSPWTVDVENLAKDLRDEKTALQHREEMMDQREARFVVEQAELQKMRKEIDAMREALSRQVIEVSADEAQNLRTLAQTYSTLAPKSVVTLFREMDDITVVKIISMMKNEVTGPLLQEMVKSGDPKMIKRAADLSEKLRLLKSSKASKK